MLESLSIVIRPVFGLAYFTVRVQRPVSRKPRKLFGPKKPFLDHQYLKTEKCIRLKLLL